MLHLTNFNTKVLKRDGYRCILTGNIDYAFWHGDTPEARRLRSQLMSANAQQEDLEGDDGDDDGDDDDEEEDEKKDEKKDKKKDEEENKEKAVGAPRTDTVEVAHIFKRSLAVYSSTSRTGSDSEKVCV